MTRRTFLTLACGVMVLSACGFQLRGQQDYPFKRLAVTGAPPAFIGRFSRMVQGGSDTVVVASAANADAILRVTESSGTSVLTMNSLGVVEEYQLNYTLYYSLVGADGTQLIPQSTIALNRAMTYSDEYSQAKASESVLLMTDMQNDAVDQLVRRLGVVHSLHPEPGQGVPPISPRAPLPPPPL
ncbi:MULTISPECIES: LPS assembly lipoprotein LptE [Paraburkholderia]|uniref:LPS-assembly lipoprotein LptE n=1 Tax=Paraburkholderia phenazinium TaxID=60549 RepID=A0A1N6LIE9_9BURK|nr:LPS assembly lipoprotein LptE [Paraburkholderia phenazinium]SIO68527.1 LPS-assembly lipoprotein [Paraburkholderia phenazinium]